MTQLISKPNFYVRVHGFNKHKITLDKIIWAVTKVSGYSERELFGSNREREILWDVKTTTEELDEYNLSKSIASYGYHFQAAHYLECFEAAGASRNGFGIIWVNKSAPHHARITLLSDEFLQMGRNDFNYALYLLKKCRDTDVWPGYPREITTLSPPSWLA